MFLHLTFRVLRLENSKNTFIVIRSRVLPSQFAAASC